MKPILVSTPRSGSTIVAEKLFNIAKDNFNYIDNLDEFFNITSVMKTDFIFIENKIKKRYSERVFTNWCNNKKELQLQRLEMLKKNSNYLIKYFPFDIDPEVENFVVNTYDIIFLERKNKIEQFLSFLGLFSEKRYSHNTISNSYVIEKLKYDRDILNSFIYIIQQYNNFKRKYEGKTLFFEDITKIEINEKNISNLLNLNVNENNIKNYKSSLIRTFYKDDPEKIIENYEEWENDKFKLLDL